ncbi:hypothetical protein BZA05DRAFT_450836 [Tricharina praecox]|uniref:uncharacterized protein n=1 Tax=Tricharina praecox TaxID=43433 RepID=UPI00221E6A91|nr:uncharacterized protein BZA05DRAFT_450836 [Tricharina praecox]KAI5858903.1 hypothetical protein BZA05DRAFT_450836 [Tricharina praecox]
MAFNSNFIPTTPSSDDDKEHQEWPTHTAHISHTEHHPLRPRPIHILDQQRPSHGTGHAYADHNLVGPIVNGARSVADGWNLNHHKSRNFPAEKSSSPPAFDDAERIVNTQNLQCAPAARRLACPFYLHAPQLHLNCANKRFAFLSRVREHISTHTYPFQCDRCHGYFSRQFTLKRHNNTCGGQKSKGRQAGMPFLHGALVEMCRVEDMVKVLESEVCDA